MTNLEKLTVKLSENKEVRKQIKYIANPTFRDWWQVRYLDIQDHHLRMYCEDRDWYVQIYQWKTSIMNNTATDIYLECESNNIKPLHEQSEETLWEIVEFLETNK